VRKERLSAAEATLRQPKPPLPAEHRQRRRQESHQQVSLHLGLRRLNFAGKIVDQAGASPAVTQQIAQVIDGVSAVDDRNLDLFPPCTLSMLAMRHQNRPFASRLPLLAFARKTGPKISLAHSPILCVTLSNAMKSNTPATHDPAELGELERDVLLIVWRLGFATADQVREQLDRPLKDSTVRTVLRRLEEKGYLAHSVDDRTFVYRPRESRQRVAGRAVRRIVDWFCEGSVETLLVGLVDSKVLDRAELQRLADRIAAAQKAAPSAQKEVQ
jgi:BlaI family penicillinase repressor